MQLKPEAEAEVVTILNVARIIVFTLASSVVMFAGYLVVMHDSGPADPDQEPSHQLSLIMAGLAFAGLFARIIVPNIVAGAHRRKLLGGTIPSPAPGSKMQAVKTEEGWLAQGFQVTTIIAGALLEGAAFANLAAYMIEAQIYSLAIAGFLVLCILALFPMRGSMIAWIERQLRTLDEERSLGQLSQ